MLVTRQAGAVQRTMSADDLHHLIAMVFVHPRSTVTERELSSLNLGFAPKALRDYGMQDQIDGPGRISSRHQHSGLLPAPALIDDSDMVSFGCHRDGRRIAVDLRVRAHDQLFIKSALLVGQGR